MSPGSPLAVATAVPDRSESRLVAGLEAQPGLRVERRCADLAELLACAAAGVVQAVIVSAGLRGLDADAVARVQHSGCALVAVVDPGDRAATARLHRLGVLEVLDADADPLAVAAAVRRAGQRRTAVRSPSAGRGDPRSALPVPDREARQGTAAGDGGHAVGGGEPGDTRPGRVVAVWGPVGAPGRTTLAVGLAAELAGGGRQTLLVDADTYGASIAQTLGLLDEAAGLAGACRAADRGDLDVAELTRHAPHVAPRLRVLTGVVRAGRWPEVRAGALGRVLQTARSLADWVVVDTGFCLERDEELSYDTAAPRRNQATLTALEEADVVVAVGSADPVGLQRLVRGLRELREVCAAETVVVANRVRPQAVGGRPGRRVLAALERYAGVHDVVLVPDDPDSLDAAMLAGRTLAEHARSSPVRQALHDVVARVQPSRVAAAGRSATQ